MSPWLVPESDLVPYVPGFPPGRRWLVLAPHADDETLGLGATLARAAAAGVEIRVAVVTDGARQGAAAEREAEARAAARELGIGEPEFWRFPDRELDRSGARLRRAVAAAVGRHAPDTLFVTSPVELHPDHRALALAAQDALRRRTLLGLRPERGPARVAAYEVSAPLQPNLLVAGDDAWERKRRAIACYSSQLAALPYDTTTDALGRFRCLTLGGCKHAEAFHVLATRDVVRRGAGAWAALMGSPLGATRRRPRP